jgi:hypothetical protein
MHWHVWVCHGVHALACMDVTSTGMYGSDMRVQASKVDEAARRLDGDLATLRARITQQDALLRAKDKEVCDCSHVSLRRLHDSVSTCLAHRHTM